MYAIRMTEDDEDDTKRKKKKICKKNKKKKSTLTNYGYHGASSPPLLNRPSSTSLRRRVQTEFKVAMTCEGCAKAVRAILSKTEGVQSVDIDVASQKVVVTGPAPAGAPLLLALHPRILLL